VDHAARIADLKRRIAVLEAARAALRQEPAPGPSMYSVYQHPDEALAGVLASGHGAGGHAGLSAGVSN